MVPLLVTWLVLITGGLLLSVTFARARAATAVQQEDTPAVPANR